MFDVRKAKPSRRLFTIPPVFAAVGVTLFLFFFHGPYLLVQASYALRDVFGARSFDRVSDPTDAENELFRRMRDIRSFGISDLGLADTDSYTRYRRVDREALVWVVSGVQELAWEPYVWNYPFVGALPYRGYYRPKAAEAEAQHLRAKGYDAIVRRVTAYSFLGVVPDPLYSFTLNRSISALADLVIHEMAHATLFVPGRGRFNENFATFIGQEGSRRYVAQTYGRDSEEYRELVAARKDREAARRLMMDLHGRLLALFEAREAYSTDGDLREAKREVYASFQEELRGSYSDHFLTDSYRWLVDSQLNNAVVDLFIKYSGDLDLFYSLLAAREDSLSAVLSELKQMKPQLRSSGVDAIRKLLEVSTPHQGGLHGEAGSETGLDDEMQ